MSLRQDAPPAEECALCSRLPNLTRSPMPCTRNRSNPHSVLRSHRSVLASGQRISRPWRSLSGTSGDHFPYTIGITHGVLSSQTYTNVDDQYFRYPSGRRKSSMPSLRRKRRYSCSIKICKRSASRLRRRSRRSGTGCQPAKR